MPCSRQELFRQKRIAEIPVFTHGASLQRQAPAMDDTLYRFAPAADRITFEEGAMGVLVLGASGRGKTAAVITPMLHNLIHSGMGGLVIDVKNNFTPVVRQLAAAAGRADDVLELGTHATAMPVNILGGMDADRIKDFLTTMIMRGVEHDLNAYWKASGAAIVGDVAFVLSRLAQDDDTHSMYTPTLALVATVINDYALARALFEEFAERFEHGDDMQARAFISRIRNEEFHIMGEAKKGSARRDSEFGMQNSWMIRQARIRLDPFVRVERLVANFSDSSSGIDLGFRDLCLRQNKIVVLRFEAGQSAPGNLLARLLKERFHFDLYRRFHDDFQDTGNMCFRVVDEFQDIIDLDDANSLDDFSWFAKAREFKVVNVVATQALSGLYAGRNRHKVDALVSNCSAKIVLQTDDPAADVFFRHFYELERPLQKLGRGEALVCRFDMASREMALKHLSVQQTFERTRDLLRGLPQPQVPETGFDVSNVQQQIQAVRDELGVEGIKDVSKTREWTFRPGLLDTNQDELDEKYTDKAVSLGVRLHTWYPAGLAKDAVILIPNGWEKLALQLVKEIMGEADSMHREIVIAKLVVDPAGHYLTFRARPHFMELAPLGQKYARLSQETCALCGEDIPGKDEEGQRYAMQRPRAAFCPNCRKLMADRVDAVCRAYFTRFVD